MSKQELIEKCKQYSATPSTLALSQSKLEQWLKTMQENEETHKAIARVAQQSK